MSFELSATSWTVAYQAPVSTGIFQERILEWVGVLFSRRSSQLRDRIQVSCTAGRFLTIWATRQTIIKGPFGNTLFASWVILNIHLSLEHYKANSGPSASGKSIYKEQTENLWEKFYRLKHFRMKERNMKMILSVGLLWCANFTTPSSGWSNVIWTWIWFTYSIIQQIFSVSLHHVPGIGL